MNPLLLELQNSNNYIVSLKSSTRHIAYAYCIMLFQQLVKYRRPGAAQLGFQYVNSRAFYLIEMSGQRIAQEYSACLACWLQLLPLEKQ